MAMINKPKPGSLAAMLAQIRELHNLQDQPPEIRQATEDGFWWFMCLAAPEVNFLIDKPEKWKKLWDEWQAEAQANFEKMYADDKGKYLVPWLIGTDPRNN